MEKGDPVSVYRQFLETFSSKIDNLCQEDCETPFRLTNLCLVPSELEGECLEWIRRSLLQHDCPYGLISQLARAVLKSFLSVVNLKDFYLETDGKESDDNDNGDSNSNSSSDEDHIENSNIIQLSSSKILPELISHIHSTVKTWGIAPPVFAKPPVKFHVCSHAIKNTRRKMEDRHVVLTDLNVLFDLKDWASQSYFSVFDGHGGLEAADYAAKHYHCHLVADENFHDDPARAMKQAYKSTDVRFLEKAKREGLRSGTTGISALIRDNKLYVGWLGDSQALLVRGGQPVQVMTPHKPEREDERRRIEELGGCVLFFGAWRVNGTISVSRAIGDASHKPFISSDADVTSVVMNGEEEYLVLACDGLWDVVSPSQVTQIVYKHANTSPGGLEDVAIGLVNAARDYGSSDNISVVVVFFKSSLSKPQPSQESQTQHLFNFQHISSNNNQDHTTTNTSTTSSSTSSTSSSSSSFFSSGQKDPKMNERLKLKPNQHQSEGSSSSSNYHHPHSSSVRDSRRWQDGGAPGVPVTLWSSTNQPSGGGVSSRVLEAPFSNGLVRQAMFYVTPREDSRIRNLALSSAVKREKKQEDRKKRTEASTTSESGRGPGADFSRQGGFTRSPRRPSVRPLSKVSQLGSSRSRFKGRKKKRVGGRGPIINETMWITSGEDTDEEDGLSVTSHGSQLAKSSSNHLGAAGVTPLTQSGSHLHITGSTFALAALGASPWGGGATGSHSHSLPQLSVNGLNAGQHHRSVLPGITAMGALGHSSRKKGGLYKTSSPRQPKSLAVLGEESTEQSRHPPPKLGRGASVLSDSIAVTNKAVASRRERNDGLGGSHMDLHSSKQLEIGSRSSRQASDMSGYLGPFKWGR